MARHEVSIHPFPAQERTPESTLPLYPAAGIEIDIERIAGEAESACEFDPHGGPPRPIAASSPRATAPAATLAAVSRALARSRTSRA